MPDAVQLKRDIARLLPDNDTEEISPSDIRTVLNEIVDTFAEYARLDGASFSGPVSGISPTGSNDFATKRYVDGRATPTVEHLLLAAVRPDTHFDERDFTGEPSTQGTVRTPTFNEDMYLAFAATDQNISIIELPGFPVNQFGRFTEDGGFVLHGDTWHIFRSTIKLTNAWSNKDVVVR